MAEVILDNVSKEFRPRRGQPISAASNVSFRARDGELLVLVGPSGSGKTTLLRMIAGLDEIDRGTISIGGKLVNDVPPKDRDVAMVFQNYALYPHMTVHENIAFPLKLRDHSKEEISRAVQETAEMLGITDLLQRKPETLSGGQRQRVAVARAIVRKPSLFLFDEPLSQIDPPMRAQMRAEISSLHIRLGATIIYVTHDQAEAMTLGQRIVVINHGEVQQIGTPIEIYNQPASMFVAAFIGSPPMNFFHGTVADEAGEIIFRAGRDPNQPDFRLPVLGAPLKSVQAYRNSRLVLGLRPEHIAIHAGPPAIALATAGPANPLATLRLIEPLGAETLLHLQVGNSGCIARASGIPEVRIGQQVAVQWDTPNARFFDPTSGQRI